MSMWTLLIALCTAIVVWSILVSFLTARPWATVGDNDFGDDIAAIDYPAKVVALFFLLAAISSLFALFVSAYVMRMDPSHGGDWISTPKPGILWLNTGLLLLSSVAMQWAKGISRHENPAGLKIALLMVGIFTLLFLGGQYLAWDQLHDSSYFQLRNPALGFFYLLTGVHAVHILGGLYVWGRLTGRAWRLKETTPANLKLSVELCTIYWHFLLLVWLVLFSLLLST